MREAFILARTGRPVERPRCPGPHPRETYHMHREVISLPTSSNSSGGGPYGPAWLLADDRRDVTTALPCESWSTQTSARHQRAGASEVSPGRRTRVAVSVRITPVRTVSGRGAFARVVSERAVSARVVSGRGAFAPVVSERAVSARVVSGTTSKPLRRSTSRAQLRASADFRLLVKRKVLGPPAVAHAASPRSTTSPATPPERFTVPPPPPLERRAPETRPAHHRPVPFCTTSIIASLTVAATSSDSTRSARARAPGHRSSRWPSRRRFEALRHLRGDKTTCQTGSEDDYSKRAR